MASSNGNTIPTIKPLQGERPRTLQKPIITRLSTENAAPVLPSNVPMFQPLQPFTGIRDLTGIRRTRTTQTTQTTINPEFHAAIMNTVTQLFAQNNPNIEPVTIINEEEMMRRAMEESMASFEASVQRQSLSLHNEIEKEKRARLEEDMAQERQMRLEQDKAYEASLAIDRAKLEKQEETDEPEETDEDTVESDEETNECSVDEPASLPEIKELDKDNVGNNYTIRFRLPDTIVTHTFNKEDSIDNVLKMLQYDLQYYGRIAMILPSGDTVRHDKKDLSLAECNIVNRMTINVMVE